MIKKIRRKTLKKKLLPLLAVSVFILLGPVQTIASQNPPVDNTALEETETTPVDSSKEALLLFWEEKELYVQTATRSEKPITQVAENIVVVTAKEIEDMNAHTVAEVLNTVPGVYVSFQGQEIGNISLLSIQGSAERHVTVLLDGVVWNFISGGNAETNSIPVGIIDRIEIIKGPASSAWGSALGGVINIITKNTSDTNNPKGGVSLAFGEAKSRDYNFSISGKGGEVGYYLYAGRQDSQGISSKGYDRDSVYAKLKIGQSKDLSLILSGGYSNPFADSLYVPSIDQQGSAGIQTYFITATLDYKVSDDLSLKTAFHVLNQKLSLPNRYISNNNLIIEPKFDEDTISGNIRLVYTREPFTIVTGFEYSHVALDQKINYGPDLQTYYGLPESVTTSPSIDKWAYFSNITLELGRLAITPGVRLDHNNISGYFLSPSIGATYEILEHMYLRGSIARGFTTPPLSDTSGGGTFYNPNPALKEERVWSYQLGFETGISDYLNLKATGFYHDMRDEQVVVFDPSTNYSHSENSGKVVRKGFELGVDTAPLYNFSLKAGFSYVHKKGDNDTEANVKYMSNLGIKYDDRKTFMAQLAGNYIWWSLPARHNARYGVFVWDFNASKKIFTVDKISVDLFTTVHNLFTGSYYTSDAYQNPHRWVEGGVRFKF